MQGAYWKGLRVVLIATIAAACLSCTSRAPERPIGEEVPHEHMLLALEALRGQDRYFLHYRRGDEDYYAAGDLKGRQLLRQGNFQQDFQAATFDSPSHTNAHNWEELSEALTPITVLPVEAWERFRDRIFSGFMPTEGGSGVAVSFDRGDYFFFYDRQGRFRARRLIDKPAWYEVSATIDLQRYFDLWQPKLKQFLEEEGLQTNEVMFNTGDLEAGAIPFIYVNNDSKLIVLIRYDEIPPGTAEQLPGSHWLQSLWHFIGSHTYSVPLRPFTSAQSLLALLSDTAVESGRTLTTVPSQPKKATPLLQGEAMDLTDWESYLDDKLSRPATRGVVDFLVDGDVFFPRFIDTVTSAQESVDIRAYIFDNDDVAMEIAELLKRRSREGIDTRVLFDGLGTIIAGGEQAGSLPEGHRPPLSIHQHLEQNSRIDVRAVKNTWLMGVSTGSVCASIARSTWPVQSRWWRRNC